ncbi:MAG: hypothetical protein JSS09_07795 [Verrucomicrobia bacterium]|nr:hypothetical protein [Verrucomicrobiota bacterium]
MPEETIIDPGLSQLREQTKNVMIPILIKAFQLKSEAGRLTEPPSRLTSMEPKSSLEEVIFQLSSLDNDLKLQQLWIESSRHQIEKILSEIRQEPLAPLSGQIKTNPTPLPSIQKSFQNTFFAAKSPSTKSSFSLRSWWKKIIGTP